ncbi:MAG: replication-relaxation family protein [Deltaproteobacteria bacterium]|nr:replication-relaxation family protein [Deltaproteobacteria bacterium]
MQLEELKSTYQIGAQRFILQPRDIAILRCCYEQQFLMYEQIERFYFQGHDPRNARRRIIKLKKAGLLRAEIQLGLTKHHLLRVTEMGRKLAQESSPFDVPQSKKVDPATLVHDRIVTDVRLRLSALWDGVWIPEKSLKDNYPQIPDGIFQFDTTGTSFAIEIENSLKGKSRFVSILKEWQRVEGVPLVFFIATNRKLFEAIRACLVHAPSKPAFGLVELDSLMSDSPRVHSPHGLLDICTKRVL